jgi:hypothetical protein
MELPLFLMVFVDVSIHFRIWTRIRIRNPRVTDPDPAKVPDPCGSGSTTLPISTYSDKSLTVFSVFFLNFPSPKNSCARVGSVFERHSNENDVTV